jgi:hypothetical protein
MTIKEAESVVSSIYAQEEARNDKVSRVITKILYFFVAVFAFALVALFFTENLGGILLLASILGSFLTLMAWILVSGALKDLGADEANRKLLEARAEFVTSRGFLIPSGSFEQLDFPWTPAENVDAVYGIARLQDRETNKLVDITLEHRAGEGFVLRDARGKIRRPEGNVAKMLSA